MRKRTKRRRHTKEGFLLKTEPCEDEVKDREEVDWEEEGEGSKRL
jgi:hypothetical protein